LLWDIEICYKTTAHLLSPDRLTFFFCFVLLFWYYSFSAPIRVLTDKYVNHRKFGVVPDVL